MYIANNFIRYLDSKKKKKKRNKAKTGEEKLVFVFSSPSILKANILILTIIANLPIRLISRYLYRNQKRTANENNNMGL